MHGTLWKLFASCLPVAGQTPAQALGVFLLTAIPVDEALPGRGSSLIMADGISTLAHAAGGMTKFSMKIGKGATQFDIPPADALVKQALHQRGSLFALFQLVLGVLVLFRVLAGLVGFLLLVSSVSRSKYKWNINIGDQEIELT